VPPERIIRGRRVELDRWRLLEAAEASGGLPAGAIIVPLAAWKERREELLARVTPVGVWLAAEDDPFQLAGDLHLLPLVAVRFAKFTDGRGYSSGALIRGRLAFGGELRAVGEIGRDHLMQLARCGFNAFALPPGRDPEAALAAFAELSTRYQGSVDDPVPLFRKRSTARSLQ